MYSVICDRNSKLQKSFEETTCARIFFQEGSKTRQIVMILNFREILNTLYFLCI